ncbi:MAG: J domain-containing protein [Alphaproteobacteria bacterium]|nr:J domain-containing protein [Alphaproteobacteria bacterium]
MSERQGSSTSGDHYDTLGVPRDASTDEIKRAYRKLARQCHPDVAGDSAEVKERFNRVREAYETLSDPVKRATYDRRGHTYFAGPGRYGGKWRPPGGHDFEQVGDRNRSPRPSRRQGRRDPANDLGLDDLFGDFGFGGAGGGDSVAGDPGREARHNQGSYGRPGSSGPVGGHQRSTVDVGGGGGGFGGFDDFGGGPTPQQGRDICMRVDVPGDVAARGGTVTLRYPRLRLTEDGRGSARYDEIHDLRVPPGMRTGQTLRVPRMGDAGLNGGPYGDLVCDLVVHADRPDDGGVQQRRGDRRQHKVDLDARTAGDRGAAGSDADAAEAVDITIVEALLGGRIRVDTPAGPVHVTIPPCTDSGTRLRLRGRGPGGVDHFVELRIVTPERLDEESRALIERFAELNPEDPA